MSMVEYYPATTPIKKGDRVVYVPIDPTGKSRIWIGTALEDNIKGQYGGSIGYRVKFDDYTQVMFYEAQHLRKLKEPNLGAEEYDEIIEFERAYNACQVQGS